MVRTTYTVNITKPMVEAVIAFVGGNNFKINAIKEMRVRYGLGLREAKELVDEVIVPLPPIVDYIQTLQVTRIVRARTVDEAEDVAMPSKYEWEQLRPYAYTMGAMLR